MYKRQPDTGFTGTIDVPYTIEDADGDTAMAIHSVIVDNAPLVGNDPPVVVDPDPAPGTPSIDPTDSENIIVPAVDGTPITIDLDDYLSDPENDSLTITPDALPTGAIFDPATNELTFTPAVDNVGDTVIDFTVTDGNGNTTNPTCLLYTSPSPRD